MRCCSVDFIAIGLATHYNESHSADKTERGRKKPGARCLGTLELSLWGEDRVILAWIVDFIIRVVLLEGRGSAISKPEKRSENSKFCNKPRNSDSACAYHHQRVAALMEMLAAPMSCRQG